jgi:predicted nucleic acid-binding protein
VAKTLFAALESKQIRLASSALIEAEVCCNGNSRNGTDRVRNLLRTWFTDPLTIWTDIDRFLARDAAQIIDKVSGLSEPSKKMRSADALHLAAAARLGCDYLMTHDGGFPIGHKVGSTIVCRPAVVWQETIFDFG